MARDHSHACALVAGPLAEQARGFAEHLTGRGYSDGMVHEHLLLLADVSRWLQRQGLEGHHLSADQVDRFVANVGRRRKRLASAQSLIPLLGYLQDQGIVPGSWPYRRSVAAPTVLLQEYRKYLRDKRGLSDVTIRCYIIYAAGFLALLSDPPGERLEDVGGAHVLAAVSRQVEQYPPASMRAVMNADRALLRFLSWSGRTARTLVSAVPSAARRPPGLPAPCHAVTVDALLDGCDRDTEAGCRDYAVLVLLKRYGVRGIEVNRPGLVGGSQDWKAGSRARTEEVPAGAA